MTTKASKSKKRGIESIENEDNTNHTEKNHTNDKNNKTKANEDNKVKVSEGNDKVITVDSDEEDTKTISEPKSFIPTLWRPYRSLGFITNSVPFVVSYEETNTFITLCIGKAFHTLEGQHLKTTTVSLNQPKKITAMEMIKNRVFTSCGVDINCYEYGHILYTLQGHKKPVTILQKFGEFLLSVDQDNNFICWDLEAKNPLVEKRFPDIHITALIHPTTYLNKILFGSSEGKLILFNIKTMQLVYTFSGWGSEVTCIAQSSVVDVVAIGLKNGTILVHNLKFDKTVMQFKQSGMVTTLSFRNDGPSFLVSGDLVGNVHIWDLEQSSLKHIMKEAHKGKIVKLQFLNQEPILISSGDDNSVKMWIFDLPDGLPRVLRFRSGHNGSPHLVKFYDEEIILSANASSLRWMHVKVDNLNEELSQKLQDQKKVSVQKNLRSRITDIDLNPLQEKIWESIITTHQDSKYVFTWSGHNRYHNTKALKPPAETGGVITAACISSCGHFVVEGTINVRIHKFNIQSGEHMGGINNAHSKSITGLQD
eukprot:TRINITY_DN5675_c0_g1_i1.p1 TRINITY_DN5675_c0_g1~~TRINITY_DN5675_c0_g1_i1.p1  ORF type:complete len:537 (-),score=83.21 TRINITY_DN5675_c0_g1_i1:212-1822(-)